MSPNAKKDESKVVAAKPKAEEVVVAEKVEEAPAMPEFKVSAFIAPGAMLALRYFKVDLTVFVDQLRIAFGVVVLLKFLVLGYLYVASGKSAEKGNVVVAEKGADGTETKKTQTIQEYDCAQVVKAVGQAGFALCLTTGIHYKWGNPTPLLFQCLMTPMGLYDDPLFKIHVLGHAAEGKLTRPFKVAPSPFAELMGGGKTEEPAVEAKDAKRGKKDKKSD